MCSSSARVSGILSGLAAVLLHVHVYNLDRERKASLSACKHQAIFSFCWSFHRWPPLTHSSSFFLHSLLTVGCTCKHAHLMHACTQPSNPCALTNLRAALTVTGQIRGSNPVLRFKKKKRWKINCERSERLVHPEQPGFLPEGNWWATSLTGSRLLRLLLQIVFLYRL